MEMTPYLRITQNRFRGACDSWQTSR